MTFALELGVSILLVVGGIFGLTGSYGLLKLRDQMQRLHAPTKASTVGVGTALIASMLHGLLIGTGFSWQELLHHPWRNAAAVVAVPASPVRWAASAHRCGANLPRGTGSARPMPPA